MILAFVREEQKMGQLERLMRTARRAKSKVRAKRWPAACLRAHTRSKRRAKRNAYYLPREEQDSCQLAYLASSVKGLLDHNIWYD